MYTRSAFFEGKIHPGQEAAFYAAIKTELLPIWRSMPHVVDVRLYRPMLKDGDAPSLFLIQEIDYPSLQAIEEAMASPMRDLAKAAHEKIMPFYSGRHFHIISEKMDTSVAKGIAL